MSLLDDLLEERGFGPETSPSPTPGSGSRLSSTVFANESNPLDELDTGFDSGFGSRPTARPRSLPPISPTSSRPASRPVRPVPGAPAQGSALSSAWRTITQPLRSIAGTTGSLGGLLGSAFDPEGYEQARRELMQQEIEGEEGDPNLLEEAAALPGLGDVIATNIPQDSIVGRIARPVVSLAGNILADPTTYVGVGLIPRLTKVGKLTRELAAAQKAVEAANVAGDVAKATELAQLVPTLAGRLAAASEAETAVSRGARALEELGDLGAGGKALRETVTAPSFTSALRGAGRFGASLPFGPIPGIAYAPEIVEGVATGAEQAIEDVRQGRLAEAAASGVGAMMTAALGAMVARGTITELKAAQILERNLSRQLGLPPPPAPAAEGRPAGAAGAAPGTAEGEIKMMPPAAAPGAPSIAAEAARAEPQAVLPPTPTPQVQEGVPVAGPGEVPPTRPDLLQEARAFAAESGGQVFTSSLQRQFKIGFAEATRLLDTLRAEGSANPAPAPTRADGSAILEPPPVNIHEPAPAAPAVPTPVEGSERIQVERTPDKTQSLLDLIEEKAASGAVLTKKELVERGLVSKNQAATYSLERLVDALQGTEAKGRLEYVPGSGYKVKAKAEEVADGELAPGPDVVETPVQPAASAPVPAAAPAPAPVPGAGEPAGGRPVRIPRSEIDRQLEPPEARQQVAEVLNRIAAERGKPLQELSPQDVREFLPGDQNKPVRALLNRALTGMQKVERERLRSESAAGAGAAAERTAAVADPLPAAGPAGASTRTALAPPDVSGQRITNAELSARPGLIPGGFTPTPEPAPARVPVVRREGPTGLADMVIPEPAAGSGRPDRPGPATFSDAGDLARQTEIRGSRATSPVAEGRPNLQPGEQAEQAQITLSQPEMDQIATRLAGGTDLSRPAVGSPIRRMNNRGQGERASDVMFKWMRELSDDPTLRQPKSEKAIAARAAFRDRLRHLLFDEPDADKASAELSKMMAMSIENQRRSEVRRAQEQAEKLTGPDGLLTVERTDDFMAPAAEGLTPEQAARLSMRPSTVAKLDQYQPDPDYTARPADVAVADWKSQVAADPDIADSYRRALAWSRNQWAETRGTRTGLAGVSTPYMDVVRGIASDLGIKIDPKRGADRIITKIARSLDEIAGAAEPRPALTDLLTDQLVASRGDAWTRRIASSPTIGDTGARAVDLEGDARSLVQPLTQMSRLSDELSRAIAGVAEAVDLPSRFGGLTPSPQLSGVRIGDDIYLNPLEAARRHPGDSRAIARSLTDTLFHELAHRKARHEAAAGDSDFIEAYARAIEESSGLYSSTIRDIESALPENLSKLVPAYESAREVIRARVNGDDGRAGRGSAPAIADRSGRAAGSPDGGVGDGVRPGSSLREGRQGAEGTEQGEGNRAGAADQGGATGISPSPGGDGVGRAGDLRLDASLTDLVASSRQTARAKAALERVAKTYAASLERFSGQPMESADAILKRFEEISKLPEAERELLMQAKPQGAVDIGLNLGKFSDALSPEQRAELGALLAIRNQTFSRSEPMTYEKLDTDMRKLLDLHTPEEFVKLKEKTGLKTPADFAFLRSAVATFGQQVDAARDRLRAAEIRKDPDAAKLASDKLMWAAAQRDAAIGLLVPATTDVARKLAFQRMMVHPLSAEENFRSRFFGAMRSSNIPKEKADELYKLFEDTIKGDGNWDSFALAFRQATKARGWDKFMEFWKAGLLGIPTQITNIASNTVFGGLRIAENSLAVIADATISGLTGAPRQRYLSEISARGRGLVDGLREILPMLRQDLANIATLSAPDISARLERGSFADDPNLRQLHGAIEGKTGEFIRIPFKTLDMTDNAMKHVVRMQEYGAHAARLAHDASMRTPGESVQHATARIYSELRKIASDPFTNYSLYSKKNSKGEQVYKNAIEAARKTMLDDVFQTPLNKTMANFNQLVQEHNLLEFLFPFRKTPFNILKEGLIRTPMGAALAARKYAKGEIDRPEFVEALTKSAVGTTMMAAAAYLALDGTITGGGPTDPKQKQLLLRTGWQPRSIKIGDSYFPYSRLQPFSTIFGLAADMSEAWQRKDMDSAEQIATKLSQALSDNVTDQSFLQGLEAFLDIVTGSKPGGREAAFRQLQASLIPNTIGVIPFAHAARAGDPLYRETEALTTSPFQAQIPGASKFLPAQFGPTGEPRERPGTPLQRLLSPIIPSKVKTDPIAEASGELVRLGKTLDKPPLYIKVGTDRVYYTPEERDEIGQAQQKMLTSIAGIMKSNGWKTMPDGKSLDVPGGKTKASIIAKIRSRTVEPVIKKVTAQATKRAVQERKS